MKAPVPQPKTPTTTRHRTTAATKRPEGPAAALGPLSNYSKTPNEYLDLIRGEKLSGALQRDLIYVIQLHTWGTAERKEWARLSMGQLGKLCATERATVCRALADLAERGIIAVQEGGKSCATKSEEEPASRRPATVAKLYKLTPEKWKDAPPYEAKPAKPVEEAAPEAEADDTESATPRRRSIGDKLLVRPGKKAACIPVRIAPKDREPSEFRIQYMNDGESAVEVSAITNADILQVTFSPKTEKTKTVVLQHNSLKTPSQSNQQVTRLSPAIAELLQTEFDGKAFDPAADPADMAFALQIEAAAGSALPAAEFTAYARAEIRDMRKSRKPVRSGILRSLAAQAAKGHQRRPAAPAPSTTPALSADEHEAMIREADDRLRAEAPEILTRRIV